MATVEKRKKKNGDSVYRITVAAGIDSSGKQIRLRRSWEPPRPNMPPKQLEKALNRAVADFEREIEQGYRIDHRQTFAEYARYVVDIKEKTGTKPRTIERYFSLLDRIDKAIGHMKLSDIRPQQLNAFYNNLAEEGVRLNGARACAKIDIKNWLKQNGYSITKFAKQIGIAPITLSAAAAGENISETSAEVIAKGMNGKIESVFEITRDTRPLSAKTILEYHRFISSVFSQAEKEMLIQYNPAAKATPPKVTRNKPDYYQTDTLQLIIETLDKAPLKWRTATYVLIDTGCRRGEAMGLKWDSINLEEGILTIERALLYSPKRGVYESTTKTGKGRILRIAPETQELLRAWKAEQEVQKKLSGDAWIDSGFVFTRDNGAAMNPDSLTDWLNNFSRLNGLPHIHPHAFRHTAASAMIANGVDLVTAANELGHSSATTTANIYAHQIAEAKAKAENVRAGLLKRKKT